MINLPGTVEAVGPSEVLANWSQSLGGESVTSSWVVAVAPAPGAPGIALMAEINEKGLGRLHFKLTLYIFNSCLFSLLSILHN